MCTHYCESLCASFGTVPKTGSSLLLLGELSTGASECQTQHSIPVHVCGCVRLRFDTLLCFGVRFLAFPCVRLRFLACARVSVRVSA